MQWGRLAVTDMRLAAVDQTHKGTILGLVSQVNAPERSGPTGPGARSRQRMPPPPQEGAMPDLWPSNSGER